MSTRTLGIIVTVFAFFTFFWNYTAPANLYWDENYHIASAQKYMNSVFFMEPHPPLGKMLIAAGEMLFDANEIDDQFIATDYGKEIPAGFSFKGYRFFPVLLGWAVAPLLFLVFLYITRKPLWAFFLSFLYVFDNALITHSRAAMLDSTMLFFCIALILVYLLIREYKESKNGFPLLSLLFGVCFAGAMATKALALIMVLLVPVTLLEFKKLETRNSKLEKYSDFDLHKVFQFLALSIASFLIVYVGLWQFHFSLGKTVIPALPDEGYYQASEQYISLVDAEQTNLPLMLKENLKFLNHYSEGVPKLNLCKDDENGSPWYFWPFGGRSINYRWETPNGGFYKYITLQVNPVVWGVALLSLVTAFAMLMGSVLIPGAKTLTYRNELLTWTGMWTAYMIAVANIDRVMYIYHYFIPLIFSFVVCAYVVLELKQLGVFKITEKHKEWALLLFGCLTVLSFQFYRPLTYYEPIDDAAFKKRMILPVWDLRCVHCDRDSKLAVPIACEE